MTCPNCGLENPETAKFCANCGTPFVSAPPQPVQTSWQNQAQYSPPPPPAAPPRNPLLKNVALGCLIVLVVFFFFGLSCTRACFGHRRYYRRYGVVLHQPQARPAVAVTKVF
ncbi:MAG: zinc-ribbon domain-containing protein [Verrucomicrobia bacterium]|nr:zinc-ribbon domain-containing protein [Verrucomicrobiota bacterium]